MRSDEIKAILQAISGGSLSVPMAMKRLERFSFEDLGFAKLDHHRSRRTGVPEVIFAPGKTEPQILKIFERMTATGSDVIITRAEKSIYDKIKQRFKNVRYNDIARVIYKIHLRRRSTDSRPIALVTAGTSDMPVAEEAAVIAEAYGAKVDRIYDVGVAGIHRLLIHQEKLRDAPVIIVVAGMEGALASVVSGLVKAPVIAVPTSVGYGASFAGLAALLAMLNSCAPGVTVVNIDNGFGAAMAALKILRRS
jgi:NCAIR mutase (PurE)-related protein